MKVLVTGHLGYLGTVMAPHLVAAGHDVVGLDSGLFASCVLGPGPAPVPALDLDIRDVGPRHLEGVDAVVHLAALSNDPLGSLTPDITYDINHSAAVRVAQAAKDAGVRHFLYASTCSVYGASGGAGLVDEQAPLAPVTPYAESKVRVEDDLLALRDSGFATTSLRNATAFGFSPRLRADIVLNNLVGHAVLTGTVLVMSDGTPWRPLVHAEDIAAAFLAVLEAPREAVDGEAFNVGHPANNVTVAEIAQAVVDAVPGSELKVTGEAGGDPRSYRVSFAKMAAKVPTFVPRWTVPDGAHELVEAYRTHGLTKQAFDQRFTRLAHLARRQAAGELSPAMRVL